MDEDAAVTKKTNRFEQDKGVSGDGQSALPVTDSVVHAALANLGGPANLDCDTCDESDSDLDS